MKTIEFVTFLNDFSEKVHEKFYPEIPNENWNLTSTGAYGGFRFGFKSGEYLGYRSPDSQKICFTVDMFGSALNFSLYRYDKTDEKHFLPIFNLFCDMINERGLNVLLYLGYGLSGKVKKKKDFLSFYVLGEKAKASTELISEFEKSGLKIYSWVHIVVQTVDYGAKQSYYLIADFESENVKIDLYKNYDKTELLQSFTEKAQIHTFVTAILKEREVLRQKEKEIAEKIKKIDLTSYYNTELGSLYIYNERVPFHITEIEENGVKKYRARFHQGYNKGTDLDKVMEKVNKKIDTYLKKKRVKAAISGGAFDVYQKFLFKILNHQVNGVNFRKTFDTKLTESELNNELRLIIDKDAEELDKDTMAYYQLYLKSIGKRHKIKKAVKLGHIYSFVSASKIFVYTEDMFKALSINENNFKTKKEKEQVKVIQETKEKLYA